MTRIHLLLPLALLLTSGCTPRGGGGGGDDDDDDGPGSTSSTAWIRVLDTFAEEDEVRHRLVTANYSNICAETRAEYDLFDELSDEYDAGVDDVIDEFGDTDAPGAQEALCELDRAYYADLLSADLPGFRVGAEQVEVSFYDSGDGWGLELPPRGYAHGSDTDDEPYYYGGAREVQTHAWLRGWDDVDCSDPDADDAHYDADSGLRYSELEQGTVWVSAPSSSSRALTTEDVVEIDDDTGSTSAISLDFEGALCEIDRRD